MATTPTITVGSLTNVPAPGSQLAAQWAQDASGLVIHRFATKAALVAWAAPNGARAVQLDNGVEWRRISGAWGQVTPWQGTGTPVSSPSGDVSPFNCNSLTIPADPGPRVATITAFLNLPKIETAATLVIALYVSGVKLAQSELNPHYNDTATYPAMTMHPVTLTANYALPLNTAQTAIVQLSGAQFTWGIANLIEYNRLDVLVTPKGY